MLHLVGCLYYLYQWWTVKKISDIEIYLLIKYIKSVLCRVAKCLSYIEEARCLKFKIVGTIHFLFLTFSGTPVTCVLWQVGESSPSETSLQFYHITRHHTVHSIPLRALVRFLKPLTVWLVKNLCFRKDWKASFISPHNIQNVLNVVRGQNTKKYGT